MAKEQQPDGELDALAAGNRAASLDLDELLAEKEPDEIVELHVARGMRWQNPGESVCRSVRPGDVITAKVSQVRRLQGQPARAGNPAIPGKAYLDRDRAEAVARQLAELAGDIPV